MFDQFASAAGLIAQLRYHRPRYCVYLAPADRSQEHVKRDELFFRAGGVKELIGFRACTNEEERGGRNPSFHNSEAYLRFRRVWNRPAEEEFKHYAATPIFNTDLKARETTQNWLNTERQHPGCRLVAVCPYANWSSRNIPNGAIIELISRLAGTLNLEVVLLGGKKDADDAQAVLRAAGTGLNACGIFSVGESAALLQSCRLAICTESGPMHLACALGVPSVIVVFSRINKHLGRAGSRSATGTPFCTAKQNVQDVSIRSIVRSQGHPCMSEITVDQILAATVSRLDGLTLAPEMLHGTRVLAS